MQEQQHMSAASAFGSSVEPEAGESLQQLQQQQAAALKCPRCESSNTKFCYYNNYNLSQPRHFCKNCRRYWTKGGALRNIPVGGGTRKNSSSSSSSSSKRSTPTGPTGPTSSSKRPSTSDPEPQPSSSASSSLLLYPNHPPAPPPPDAAVDHELDFTGTFSSLLQSHGQFENILDVSSSPAAAAAADLGDLNRSNDDNLLSWANGWPDLAIYTPGSTFQ